MVVVRFTRDGSSFECQSLEDAADLHDLLKHRCMTIGAALDGLSRDDLLELVRHLRLDQRPPPQVRQPDESRGIETPQAAGFWHFRALGILLEYLSPTNRKILHQAGGFRNGTVTLKALAAKLGVSAKGLGPSLRGFLREAARIAPELPAPFRVIGRAGERALVFEFTFLEAVRGSTGTTPTSDGIGEDI